MRNCDKDQPSSGNSSLAFYSDYSEIGAYDCTNFISHCMLAGGAKENTKWWFTSTYNKSSSWAGVNTFRNFIINNTLSTGPRAVSLPLAYNCPSNYVNWQIGDIIQIKYSDYGYPNYGHSTVITGSKMYRGSSGKYLYEPLITSRTSDYGYNKNKRLTQVYNLDFGHVIGYRLIRLTKTR